MGLILSYIAQTFKGTSEETCPNVIKAFEVYQNLAIEEGREPLEIHDMFKICTTLKRIVGDFILNNFNMSYFGDRYTLEMISKVFDSNLLGVMKYFADKMKEMAIIDGLTGLFNRQYYSGKIKEEISRCGRNCDPLVVIAFDIDHFKGINDKYGHDGGDKVLKGIGEFLLTPIKNGGLGLRNIDTSYRLGGEEFFITLPSTDNEGGMKVAKKLRKGIENLIIDGIKVTVSVGIAEFEKGDDSERIGKKADIALYKAKNSGRNKVVIFDDSMIPEETGK